MSPALGAGLVMLSVLAAVFVIASYPGGPEGWVARLGRGGLVSVLLATGVAVVGVSIVLLPAAMVAGTALLVAGVLMLAIGALAAMRGQPSDRTRLHAPPSAPPPGPPDSSDEARR